MLSFEMAGEMGTNLTRRDALRRGTLLGAGAVWAAPAVRSLTMSSTFAAATSPVVIGEEVETTTTTGETPTTAGETPTTAGATPTTVETEVEGIVVTQPPGSDPQGPGIPVVSGDDLPLTGIEARDAALLGTGLLAVGAALVQATRKDRAVADAPESE